MQHALSRRGLHFKEVCQSRAGHTERVRLDRGREAAARQIGRALVQLPVTTVCTDADVVQADVLLDVPMRLQEPRRLSIAAGRRGRSP